MGVVLAWAAGWPGKAEVERESGSGKAKSDTRPGGGELPDDEDRLRTAVVNIQELFRQYHKVKRAEEEINMERARIQKEHNDLAGRLRSMDQGLRELEARLRSTGLTDGERASLERKQGVRFQERELLRRERMEKARQAAYASRYQTGDYTKAPAECAESEAQIFLLDLKQQR